MGIGFENYSCSGQMNIYDFIEKTTEEEELIWDEDIRSIKEKLEELAVHFGCTISGVEFRVWDHVPRLGYRLWLDMKIPKEVLVKEDFKQKLEEIVKDASDKEVELTPMWGACIFRGGEDFVKLSFTTMFLNKARQRIK